MSPFDTLVRSVPAALSQARQSSMTQGLAVTHPWRQFAAFVLLSTALFFAAGLTVGIAMQISPELRTLLTGSEGVIHTSPLRLLDEGIQAVSLGVFLGMLAFTILLGAAIAYRQRLSAFLWPSRRFDAMQFGVGMLAMSCVAVMLMPVYVWQGSEWAPPIADGRYLDWTRPAYLVLMTIGLLIAAAAEEVVCRGVMLRLTSLIVRHPLILCLINGLIFSALHLDPNPVAFVARMLSGMVWTWAALRLGGLEFATGAHLANNLIITLFWQPLSEMEVGGDTPWAALLPEVFTAVIIVLMVERLAGRREEPT